MTFIGTAAVARLVSDERLRTLPFGADVLERLPGGAGGFSRGGHQAAHARDACWRGGVKTPHFELRRRGVRRSIVYL